MTTPAPTQTFIYADPAGAIPGNPGDYDIIPNNVTHPVVQDYYDNPSANPQESLTQLGDIANDHFHLTINGHTIVGIYDGQTSNGSIVAYFPSYSMHYLLTDTNYGSSTAVFTAASEHTVCYVSGTLIRAARGEAIVDIAVENLRVGDFVVTTSGAHRPIKWLGHRTVDAANHPRPTEAMPIRISAHAFAPNRPARDLFVSPGHAICVDVVGEVLIPAAALINGSTVQQVEVDKVTYWHVELDSHDILLAHGLPAESYIDVGNRAFFIENQTIDLTAAPDGIANSTADCCRPRHGDGPVADAVRKQLQTRARTLGWTLQGTPFAGLHVVADGMTLQPTILDLTARFLLPADARDVWLVSDTSVPAFVAESPDRRTLGVCLKRLTIDDGLSSSRQIALEDPRLEIGFQDVEALGARRWTAGRARLPADLWLGCRDSFFLRVDLAGPALPRWLAPSEETVADTRDLDAA